MFSKNYILTFIVSMSIYKLYQKKNNGSHDYYHNYYYHSHKRHYIQKYHDLLNCYHLHHPNDSFDKNKNTHHLISKMNFQDIVSCQTQYFDFMNSLFQLKK